MLLTPKKVKYKKVSKGSFKIKKLNIPKLSAGDFGIVAIESGYIHSKQLEASRQTISRHLERKANIFIPTFPDRGVTKKAAQVRIGKGVGKTKYWVLRVDPGKLIFEISGIFFSDIKLAFKSGAEKLPLKVKLITR